MPFAGPSDSSGDCSPPGMLGMPDRLALTVLAALAHREGAAHLLELGAGGHLLGVDRGLDAVEEALEPADELGLRDPQLALGRACRPR